MNAIEMTVENVRETLISPDKDFSQLYQNLLELRQSAGSREALSAVMRETNRLLWQRKYADLDGDGTQDFILIAASDDGFIITGSPREKKLEARDMSFHVVEARSAEKEDASAGKGKRQWGSRMFDVGEGGAVTYKVSQGDTLWSISTDVAFHRLSRQPSAIEVKSELSRIARENGIANLDFIHTGRILTVSRPGSKQSHTAIPAPVSPPAPTETTAAHRGGLNEQVATNISIIAGVARNYGIDPALAVAVAHVETGGLFDARIRGDNGHSIGLFQLHDRGQGSNMTVEQREDPRQNAQRAISTMAAVYRDGRAIDYNRDGRISPGEIAATAQRPLDQRAYAELVNSVMPQARQLIAQTQLRSGSFHSGQ